MNKRKLAILLTELDILYGNIAKYQAGKITTEEVMKCVLVFRNELEKLRVM